jgi:hypothetical protein
MSFSMKQSTAKCPSPEGPVTTAAVPHFFVTLAWCKKSQNFFTLGSISNITVQIKTCGTHGFDYICATANSSQDVSCMGMAITTKNAQAGEQTDDDWLPW